MRSHDERQQERGGSRPESQRREGAGEPQRREEAAGGEVARPLPSSAEPGARGSSRRNMTAQSRRGLFNDPWDLMRSMNEEIDRFVDRLRGGRSLTSGRSQRGEGDPWSFASSVWAPQVEVLERPNAILLRADLPGLDPEDVDVSIEDGMLILSGERKQEERDEGEGYFRSERSYGSFYRAFSLPDGADDENIDANFKNGVLEIRVPVSERQSQSRRIKVNS